MAVAQELEAENYHDIDRINARKDNVLRLWQYLLELLRARRMRLELSLQLQQNFQVRNLDEISRVFHFFYLNFFFFHFRKCFTFWIRWRN